MPDQVKLIDFRKELKAYSAAYIPYLKDLIKLDSNNIEWVHTAKDYPELLNFFPEQPRPFDSYGTTDVAVVQSSAVRANQPEKGLLALFDINRYISENDHAAAVARLLVANFKSPETKPIVMVTDLQNQWHLLWMNGNTLRRQSLKDNSHAAHAVKLALGVDAAIGEGDKAFVDRQRVPNERIPQQRAVKFEVRAGRLTFL